MIVCKIHNLGRYLGLSENLDIAIRYLLTHDLSNLAMGRNEIDGEAVFINRSDYDTVSESIIEGHIRYADIHIVLEGEEEICGADVSTLKEIEHKEEIDYIGFSGSFQSVNILRPGDALIVFPEDAHSPMRISGDKASHVKKAVVKVLL